MSEPVDRTVIRDPKRLRALSHPLRWKLIELIGSEGSATATRCAQTLGESVASCSYHLNMLAKYDFIQPAAGGQGREKPWQLTTRNQSFSGIGLDLDGRLAAEAASEAFIDHEFGAMRERLKHRDTEPEEWLAPTGITATTLHVTIEEATEIEARVRQILDAYDDRWDDPDKRPEGSRQVRYFFSAFLNAKRP